jgi:hypothetical protein
MNLFYETFNEHVLIKIQSDKMLEKMPENFERLFLYREEENKILIGID